MKSKNALPVPENGHIVNKGNYYLENNFYSSSEYAIKIEASNVTIDLNGWEVITTIQDKTKLSFGIYAINSCHCEVYNGLISGSAIGIHAPYSKCLNIEQIIIQNCTMMGINFGGLNNSIFSCLIRNIKGMNNGAYSVGINASEAIGALIKYNNIENIYRADSEEKEVGEGVGILLGHDSQYCELSKNRLANDKFESHTYGIWAVGKKHLLSRNFIYNQQIGIYAGDSKLIKNTIVLQEHQSISSGISGAMAECEGNIIVNYGNDYHQNLQEDVTKNLPFKII